jgi:alpha-mannosidase
VDETGASIPFHVEQSYGTVSRATEISFVATGVPSLGYKTYFMVPAEKADAISNACELKLEDPDGKNPNRVLGSDSMENQFYRVSVDRVTGRVNLDDKELKRPVLTSMELVASEERGGNSIAIAPASGRTLVFMPDRVEVEENNSVRAVMRIAGTLGGESVIQRLALYRNVKRLDIENTLDWKQNRLMKIEQLFPCSQSKAKIRYGVPFGSADGDDLMPNSGPRGGDEISREQWKQLRQVQDWIFAGTPDLGLTITTDRLLVTLGEGVIRAGMLRGTYSTTGFSREGKPVLIPVPPAGKYVFRYSVSSGKGDWTAAKSWRIGMASSNPLIPITSVDELSAKMLPPTHSFCSVAGDNLLITALKKAEAGDSVVLRAVEIEGARVETPIEFAGATRTFRPVNLLEEETQSRDDTILRIAPFEISSIRLKIK